MLKKLNEKQGKEERGKGRFLKRNQKEKNDQGGGRDGGRP
jgi:hypothetical protein